MVLEAAEPHAVMDHRQGATMTETPTASTTSTEERRLVRPAEDRVLAGVCAGLGRYFGVNPLVYRVTLAGLVLLGGIGLIVYAAAWLVIPDERRGDSVVEQAVRDHRHQPWLAVGVGLVGIALLIGITGSDVISHPGNEWLAALLIGLAIVWWQLRDRTAEGSGTAAAVPPADDGRLTQAVRPGQARRRFPVFLPTMGVVLAGAGILGVLDAADLMNVNWTVALAVGVALVGIAVAVGAFFGGVGWLAVVGLVLAAILVGASTIHVPLDGPIGDRTEHPVSVRELQESYPVSIGQLNLDLRDLVLPQGTTEVSGSVGIGQLNVVVPYGVNVEIDAHVTGGEARALGEEANGHGVDRLFVDESAGPGAPKLLVEADVGFGELVVRRR
jgi:phage shock protein PspC (stress-responsive transcriptional regulator)